MEKTLEQRAQRKYKIASRIYGAALTATFGYFAVKFNHPLMYCLSSVAVVEGVGDIISGDHHHLSSKLLIKLGLFKE